MATEKLAKGFLSKGSGRPPKRTHYLLRTFMNVSRSQHDWREQIGYGQNPKAYGYYIDSLLPVAEQIENLVPEATFNRINAEYPWINEDGDVECPCKCDFAHIDATDLVHFKKLVHRLFYIVGFRD
jgi:hypothetical protein